MPCSISNSIFYFNYFLGPKDISIRGKVDLGCPKKAPLRTFIRKSKRNLDAMVNNSNFEMQEGDKLPIPMKEVSVNFMLK